MPEEKNAPMHQGYSPPRKTTGTILGAIVISAIGSFVILRLNELLPNFLSSESLAAGLGVIKNGETWVHLWSTLTRFWVGWSIALVAGASLGLLMGRNQHINQALGPIVHSLRPIPSAAVIPLAMLLFSSAGDVMKVGIIAYGVIWPVLLSVHNGCRNLDPILYDTAKTLGKTGASCFAGVTILATLPSVFSGARIGLGIGLLLAVTVEMIVPDDASGFGFLILDYNRRLSYTEMLVCIIILGLFGYSMDIAFKYLRKYVIPWSYSERHN